MRGGMANGQTRGVRDWGVHGADEGEAGGGVEGEGRRGRLTDARGPRDWGCVRAGGRAWCRCCRSAP